MLRLYTAPDCPKCASLKKALLIAGTPYEEHSLEYHLDSNEGWRERGDPEVAAGISATGQALKEVPYLFISEDECLGYEDALGWAMKQAVGAECEGGRCKI